jgi:hypothetical protein
VSPATTTFFSEMIAVGIGVFGGFWADSLREKHIEKKGRIRVLKLLREELNTNLTIMDIIRKGLAQNKVPYAHLQLSMWGAVSNKIDLISNDELLDGINAAYYNFDMFEKTLDMYIELAILSISQSHKVVKANIQKRLDRHREVMLDRLRTPKNNKDTTIVFRTNRAIDGIKIELRRLDC